MKILLDTHTALWMVNDFEKISHNYHRDPFDRIIVATAMSENMTILTKDSDFTKYKVSVLW